MQSILSFFLAIIVAIEGFFGGLFGKNNSAVKAISTDTEYYCDGQSENGLLLYGVEGDINLFAPDENINVILECNDEELFGTKAKISVENENTGFNQSESFTFKKVESCYSYTFYSSLNGVYKITLETTDGESYEFSVGIIPENSMASFDFYYGIQPYITRAKSWGEAHRIPGLNEEDSIEAILDTAAYMGVNLVREDGVSWSGMQSSAYGEVDFTLQDELINKVNSRGMKYNWVLGDGTTEWSISDQYKNSYDASYLWAYAPNEEYWEDYVTKLADHYGENEDILWEIWNEPNWDFFKGTQEEYFTLLENTAEILKTKNSKAYVYSGGLAVAESDNNKPYLEKACELIKEGLLDNWGYHNHDGNEYYCDYVNYMLANASSAGLTSGGINSESGINGVDASLIARKALYTRATGANGFVSYSFREANGEFGDINDYAVFDNYLQPKEAVITYSTVIRFLGHADFIKSEKIGDYSFRDEYSSGEETIYVYYSFGESTEVTLPENSPECYDMYGNPMSAEKNFTLNQDPVYVVVKG